MVEKPIYAYYCEVCDKAFSSRWECDEHERKCKARQERIRNCSYCNGTGFVDAEQEIDMTDYDTFGNPIRSSYTSFYRARCPRCNWL